MKRFFSQSMGMNMNVSEGDKVLLHFGAWNREVEICFSEGIEENTMCISSVLMDQFTVPEDIDFEYRWKGNELYIGPVLGIVRGSDFIHLNQSLTILLPWVKDYQNIKGLVIIFPLSDAVFNKKTGGVGKKYRLLLGKLNEGRFINSSGTG